jgi:hypothetical protein
VIGETAVGLSGLAAPQFGHPQSPAPKPDFCSGSGLTVYRLRITIRIRPSLLPFLGKTIAACDRARPGGGPQPDSHDTRGWCSATGRPRYAGASKPTRLSRLDGAGAPRAECLHPR